MVLPDSGRIAERYLGAAGHPTIKIASGLGRCLAVARAEMRGALFISNRFINADISSRLAEVIDIAS
jgi:hypothetical protein